MPKLHPQYGCIPGASHAFRFVEWRGAVVVPRPRSTPPDPPAPPSVPFGGDGLEQVTTHGHGFCPDAATGRALWRDSLRNMDCSDVTVAIGGKFIPCVAGHTQFNC
jgi:hypothetical protein